MKDETRTLKLPIDLEQEPSLRKDAEASHVHETDLGVFAAVLIGYLSSDLVPRI